MQIENCLRCGLPEEHKTHNSQKPPPEGWHPFRGLAYLDALEDALLFVREQNRQHKWKRTGIVIDTADSFNEKRCEICGAINWGGKENTVCFGNNEVEKAIVEAHNRRAFNRQERSAERLN